MKLKQLHPNDISSLPERGIQELMRGFLVRTNFVPGVRHVIGWRGVKECFTSVEGWSAKIKGFSGVFGMYFDMFDELGDWLKGRFVLLYFPDPQEELVEYCSLQAGAYTQRKDYLPHIRDFLLYPKLCELFDIGIIDLGINKRDDALILGLHSISHQRLIAKDGVSLPQAGRMVEVVAPGGYDQNFPSYNTAFGFYQVLAASFTFNLEAPPSYMSSLRQPGKETVYDAVGCYWENRSDDAHEESVCLGYGKADFKEIIETLANQTGSFRQDVTWEKGKGVIPEYGDALWWKAHEIGDYKTLDKNMLGIDDRPQFIVLTGFLGSGKTSFLQHFIEYQVQLNRFVAIIQNEIGEIGLDGKLLDHDYAVTEIDEGCICCTLVGNLKSAIHQILSSFHPDYIVLETTGLANPYNLLDEISALEELVRFDSITTIVDGVNIEQSLKNYDVAREQIKAADILLLNKKDLLTDDQLRDAIQELRRVNPVVPILSTAHGDIQPALLYGIDMEQTRRPDHKEAAQDQREPHHPSHEQDGLSSLKISFAEPLDRTRFIKAVEAMPPQVFRSKGVVDFTDADTPVLFQYVGGRFELSEFHHPNMSDRFLVLIGQDIDRAAGLIKRYVK
ncbi:MAG: GTP-binding protein [Thermodesulfobacteriota bacterium]|nr:GTP-binding protein [Thermodesulfobacteriota bacterium]